MAQKIAPPDPPGDQVVDGGVLKRGSLFSDSVERHTAHHKQKGRAAEAARPSC
jgi:hypothetical protein